MQSYQIWLHPPSLRLRNLLCFRAKYAVERFELFGSRDEVTQTIKAMKWSACYRNGFKVHTPHRKVAIARSFRCTKPIFSRENRRLQNIIAEVGQNFRLEWRSGKFPVWAKGIGVGKMEMHGSNWNHKYSEWRKRHVLHVRGQAPIKPTATQWKYCNRGPAHPEQRTVVHPKHGKRFSARGFLKP